MASYRYAGGCRRCGSKKSKLALVCILLCSHAKAEDATTLVNIQRERAGLGPLVFDEALQAGAEEKAAKAATMSFKGHLGGSYYGATYEGIGYDKRNIFRSCYLYTAKAGSRIGAAIVKGKDGFFYCCFLVKSKVKLEPHPK
jgi:hypothetical protein